MRKFLCLWATVCVLSVGTVGAQGSDSATNPPTPSSDGSKPERRLNDAERAAIASAFDGHTALFGSVSAQVLARVDRFAGEMAQPGLIRESCASKYALVPGGRAGAPFAVYAYPREASAISIGGIDLELQPVRAGGGLIERGGKGLQQPDAGREVVLEPYHDSLYRSGLTKSIRLLVTREGDHSCVPSRVGCRLYDASLTLSRYDIWGSVISPELRWAGEEKLGSAQVEVVCGAERRSGDPFFTVPWYEYALAYFLKLFTWK